MNYILKNEIFDVYELARELFNDYYNGKEEYSQEDYERIFEIMESLKEDIKEIKNELYYLKESE